jgi:hypothetical protein
VNVVIIVHSIETAGARFTPVCVKCSSFRTEQMQLKWQRGLNFILRVSVVRRRAARSDRGGIMGKWRVEGNQVKRESQVIALIGKVDGKLSWAGLNMERIGFDNEADIVEDVKYFYRYRRPNLTLIFKSGRKVVFD